jgi:hypothetical protein
MNDETRPRHAKSEYSSKIGSTDIQLDKATGEIHFLTDHNVTRGIMPANLVRTYDLN